MNITIQIPINTKFCDDFSICRKLCLENNKNSITSKNNNDNSKFSLDEFCEKITNSGGSVKYIGDENLRLIAVSDYSKYKRGGAYSKSQKRDDDHLVYRIEPGQNDEGNKAYAIYTGIYCGELSFLCSKTTYRLEITTSYSQTLFHRMLRSACGIYIDETQDRNSNHRSSIYALLPQYMFLISLRKLISKAVPKRYVMIRERGYSINGELDIEGFINNDIISFDKKMSYKYSKQLEIQSIIDVLCYAFKCCKLQDKEKMLPKMVDFQNQIMNLYSGVRPSGKTVNDITNEKCLSNSLYSGFRVPLRYAKLLIFHRDALHSENADKDGVNGYLIDSSFLWEMYLYNLMLVNLDDEWKISCQEEISFYENTFFNKLNYPDFVLENRSTGKIYVLDAKFKSMKFQNFDVDNNDIRQLHSYSYYYALKYPDKFAGCALIYPTKSEPKEGTIASDWMYGIESESSKARFAILTLKDVSNGGQPQDESDSVDESEELSGNEQAFIESLKSFLKNS